MKKLLLALALLLAPTAAFAQCNGVFPANTICGKITTPGPPGPIANNVLTGVPGGTNGQIEYNNSGVFGGFTASQDCTITPTTGVVNCTRLQNIPVTTTSAATNDVLYFNGTTWIHNALLTLINTICVAAPSSCTSLFGYVSPLWYGAVCNGSTNDITAIQAAMTAAAGKALLFPTGTCVINNLLNVPANIKISGTNRDLSTIKQTGQATIFSITDVANTEISDLTLLSTDTYTSWTASNFGPVRMNFSASSDNHVFRNLHALGWNPNYWFYGANTAGIVTNTTFDRIWISSTAADVPTDPTPGNNSNWGIVLFSGTGGVRWSNTTISNSLVDAQGLCYAYTLFSNHVQFSIINNRALNVGGPNTGGHCTNALADTNSYGILVYDVNADHNPPTGGIILGNYISNPIASGIYLAGDGVNLARTDNSFQLLVANNVIVGETFADLHLPRGAIALTDATDIHIVGNYLYNNANGVSLGGQNAGVVTVASNHCFSISGGSHCMMMSAGLNGSSNTDSRVIKNNYFASDGDTLQFTSATGSRWNSIDISANSIVSKSPASGVPFTGQFVAGTASFAGNTFSGNGTAASFAGTTGTLSIGNNLGLTFSFAQLPAVANGSNVFVSDGAPASSPCTGTSSGSMAFRQNGAWKCF